DDLMTEAKISRETLVDKGLQFNRRSINGGHYYFISNPGKQFINEWVPLQTTEKNIVLFNPMDVNNGIAKTRLNNGTVEVLLQLQAGESCILQTAAQAIKGKGWPYYEKQPASVEIKGSLTIQFLKGGPAIPPTVDKISL